MTCFLFILILLVPGGWDIEGRCMPTWKECEEMAESYKEIPEAAAWCEQQDKV